MSKKLRILIWLNVFLLVINGSAFVTFLMMNGSAGEQQHDDRFSSDKFLKNELNLSEEQYKQIEIQNAKVFRAYQALVDRKCEINFELIEELSSDNPSKPVMDSLINMIGRLETSLKAQTVKHFSNVKEICTGEQRLMLDQLLKEMMEAGRQCRYCNKQNCSRRDQLQQKK